MPRFMTLRDVLIISVSSSKSSSVRGVGILSTARCPETSGMGSSKYSPELDGFAVIGSADDARVPRDGADISSFDSGDELSSRPANSIVLRNDLKNPSMALGLKPQSCSSWYSIVLGEGSRPSAPHVSQSFA